MEGAVLWASSLWLWLSLSLLRGPGGQGLSCNVTAVDWAAEFEAECLNLSGLGVRPPRNGSLRARRLALLDLSRNGLRELPPPGFFAQLPGLRVLRAAGNPLGRVDAALAALCVRVEADCSCALAPWLAAWPANCSDRPPARCLGAPAAAWRDLPAFLRARCAPGLRPAAAGALAAGALLLLALAAAAAALLARRARAGRRDAGKAAGARDAPGPGAASQPRYSSRDRGPRPRAPAPRRPSTPDYENMFVGDPAAPRQQDRLGAQQPPEDGDLYMNYRSPDADCSPVYCNLQALGRAAPGEEEYVVPGR
ncbi:leucine-rich repeat-containing protein 25 [Microcebus murinus]|uniref:leucine-rich repeat-containing protein 25 n=1 Tax=Microcebus murinus TaxID=30608 RepID=UPI003F6B8993